MFGWAQQSLANGAVSRSVDHQPRTRRQSWQQPTKVFKREGDAALGGSSVPLLQVYEYRASGAEGAGPRIVAGDKDDIVNLLFKAQALATFRER